MHQMHAHTNNLSQCQQVLSNNCTVLVLLTLATIKNFITVYSRSSWTKCVRTVSVPALRLILGHFAVRYKR